MDLKFDLLAIVQQLEDTPEGTEQFLSELLFFSEFQTLANSKSDLERDQLKLAQAVIKRLPGDGAVRRGIPADAQKEKLTVELEPPQRTEAWQEPVALELPVVAWDHGEAARIAFVPALGIEVVASNAKKLPEMLKSHVDFELKRRGLAKTLLQLAFISRTRKLQLKRIKWKAQIETPAERIKEDEPKKERILGKVGSRIEIARRPHAYCREREVEQLAKLLGGRHPSCVLIVGESGVGKTAITLELARLRAKLGFSGRYFYRTSGSRIVAGQTGFGMWQERCRKIIDEAKDIRCILSIGSLHELMQVGQSSSNSESIASFLRPAMVRADLLVVAECTPGQLAAIESRDPKILDPFRRIVLEEPKPEVSREILQHLNREADARTGRLTFAAVLKLEALHRRYMTASAFPGRPARFLRGLRAESEPAEPMITEADVTRAFSRETGLPSLMLDEEAPFDQPEILRWFLGRVHAQDPAVELVVDRLAIVKAQLSRPRQPLASFLFTGPTGVGKTELAKTLAEFLYGSKDRMLRLDMSEYGSHSAASRLVSSSFGESEGILTSRVRDQPFSVILLDEFEKAHPSLFDLFLQVLGEGRLTDAAGRLADFSNCVIIMTSNLGAESFQRPELGFAKDGEVRRDAQEHFLSVVREKFRPEFFNRIDRVIPFAPLDHAAIRTIAVREIGLATKRDGLTGKRIALEVTDRALDWIVQVGHDPRYGARPLKRAIEQRLLLPVSEFLNRSARHGGCITIDLVYGASTPKLDYTEDEGSAASGIDRRRTELAREIDHASEVRRDYLRLNSSSLVAELESEKRRILKQKDIAYRKAWKKHKSGRPEPIVPYIQEAEKRLEFLEGLLGRLESETSRATGNEVQLMVEFYAESAAAPPDLTGEGEKGDAEEIEAVKPEEFQSTLLDIFSATKHQGDSATLFFLSEDTPWMCELADSYAAVAREFGAELTGIGIYHRKDHDSKFVLKEKDKLPKLLPIPVEPGDYKKILSGKDREIGALSLQFEGANAMLRFSDEAGLHQKIRNGERSGNCLIGVHEIPFEKIEIPPQDLTQIRVKDRVVRRLFDEAKNVWKDQVLQELGHKEYKGRGFFSVRILAKIIEETLQTKARKELE